MIQGLDPHSPTWLALAEWARAEIEAARDRLETKNDAEDQDRGRIQALREVLDLGVERPRPVVAPRAPLPDRV